MMLLSPHSVVNFFLPFVELKEKLWKCIKLFSYMKKLKVFSTYAFHFYHQTTISSSSYLPVPCFKKNRLRRKLIPAPPSHFPAGIRGPVIQEIPSFDSSEVSMTTSRGTCCYRLFSVSLNILSFTPGLGRIRWHCWETLRGTKGRD